MIEDYFRPADIDISKFDSSADSLFSVSDIYFSKGKFPKVHGHKIAIFGVDEYRGGEYQG